MNLIPSSTDEKQFVKWAKNIIQQSHFSKQSTILNWRRILYSLPLNSKFGTILQNIDTNNDQYMIDLGDGEIGLSEIYLLALFIGHGRWTDPRISGITLSCWSRVIILSLENIDIPPNETGDLIDSLAENQTLTSLNLNGVNGLGGYADEDDYFIPVVKNGRKLAHLIEKNKKLIYLSSKYCHMGMLALNSIAKALETNKSLTSLNLGNNTWWWDERTDELLSDQNFDPSGIRNIAKSLCLHNTTLVQIEILSLPLQHLFLCGSGYALKVYDIEEDDVANENIETKEQREVQEHQEVDRNEVTGEEEISKKEEDENKINDPLTSTPIIDSKRLTFGVDISYRDMRVGRPDVIFAVECIKFNQQCKSLSFSGCKIEKDSIISLCELIHIHDGIEKLDLTRIETRLKDSQSLANSVIENINTKATLKIFSDIPIHRIKSNEITNLMLKGAGIGTHGALVLCNLLSRSGLNSLKSLYLSSNNINTFGAKAFGKVFAVNTTITFIDLRDNLIEAAAIDVMADGMESNPGICNLETLDLQDNVIGGYMISKSIPELLKFTNIYHGHASKRMNQNYEDEEDSPGSTSMLKESSLFVGGNGIKLPLAHKLRDDYEGSALKVFV